MTTIDSPARSVGRVRPRPGPRRGTEAVWFAVPFVLLVAIWWLVVEVTGTTARTFPQVTDVIAALAEMAASGDLARHLGASVQRMLIGAVLAVVTAIPFGIALGSSPRLSAFFSPLLRFSVALAGIAWIPIATLWLGYGDRAVIFIVWNAMFFALTYNTVLGVQQIPVQTVRAARSMGTRGPRIVWEVLLPGALPSIVTGLRIGLGYGWRGLVAAEIIATNAGLGYALFLAQSQFDTGVIIASMVIIGVLWLLMDRLMLAPLERRTVERWGMKAVS